MNAAESQRGVALLMAIIVVAIGTMIAVNLMWRETLDMRRTEAALAADQGLMYVQGAEAWAADILRQDLVETGQRSTGATGQFQNPQAHRARPGAYRPAGR